MDLAFSCTLSYNSDISKIKNFFDGTDTMFITAGKPGIGFSAITTDNSCMYVARIHSCDIYQLYTRESRVTKVKRQIIQDGKIATLEVEAPDPEDPWHKGFICMAFPAALLINFIKQPDEKTDIKFTINTDVTKMIVSIMHGKNIVRSISIPLTTPSKYYETPRIPDANVVIKVNDFKKLCSSIVNSGSDIKVQVQNSAIRLQVEGFPVTYGDWEDSSETYLYQLDKTPFSRAKKITIGNTKNSNAGLYIKDDIPLIMFKVKLGVVDFTIYGKRTEGIKQESQS